MLRRLPLSASSSLLTPGTAAREPVLLLLQNLPSESSPPPPRRLIRTLDRRALPLLLLFFSCAFALTQVSLSGIRLRAADACPRHCPPIRSLAGTWTVTAPRSPCRCRELAPPAPLDRRKRPSTTPPGPLPHARRGRGAWHHRSSTNDAVSPCKCIFTLSALKDENVGVRARNGGQTETSRVRRQIGQVLSYR
ncbi:hypothetical protein LZ30DRAFT_122270 [Colletotrichum cereale]|nr:hypothetical protein LZ30DRAFT_122270 [Colletotrichum cereale]